MFEGVNWKRIFKTNQYSIDFHITLKFLIIFYSKTKIIQTLNCKKKQTRNANYF